MDFEGTYRPDTFAKSTADSRTRNNVVRHEYRTLSGLEKHQMQKVKDMGAEFIAYLHEIGGTRAMLDSGGPPPPQGSRDLSLAQTHMEDAVMRAVRHITG